MRVDELDYDLPEELIARHPLPERDQARLCVVDEDIEHARVSDLVERLAPGSLLVVNDTRVLPARLRGRKKPGGGRVELLVVRSLDPDGPSQRWSALGHANKPLRAGQALDLGEGLAGSIATEVDDEGLLTVRLESASGDVAAAIERLGSVPLPPYLARDEEPGDRERYQTLFARHPGAVAAPTAGLHFSERLLARLRARGVRIQPVTLHVGPGTFRPVAADDLDDHAMHPEAFDIGEDAAGAIAAARSDGAPVVAVGTTVVRALEAAADRERPGLVRAVREETRLLIQPGYRFRVVDALVTNFHLPRSTLLALVYAFGGAERVRHAYREAVAQRYRFFSYGDAMFLPRRAP